MIVSIEDALRALNAIEPKRFYLRQSRQHGHPTLPNCEVWFVQDTKAPWHESGCTFSEVLGEAVSLMAERIRKQQAA